MGTVLYDNYILESKIKVKPIFNKKISGDEIYTITKIDPVFMILP